MKTNLFAGLMALTLGLAPSAQGVDALYDNVFDVEVPSAQYPKAPLVDATTFFNEAGAKWVLSLSAPWSPYDTENFFNFGYIALGTSGTSSNAAGLEFKTYPFGFGSGLPHRANIFANIGGGGLNGTMRLSATNFTSPGSAIGTARLLVDASSITNSGTIIMDHSSLARFSGRDIDLSYGTVQQLNPSLGGFSFGPNTLITGSPTFTVGVNNAGMLDNYWGIGLFTNQPTGGITLEGDALSPTNTVMYRTGKSNSVCLSIPKAMTYQSIYQADSSNVLWEVVAVGNSNPAVSNLVFLQVPVASAGTNTAGYAIAIEWIWFNTNSVTGGMNTNYLTLLDTSETVTQPALTQDGSSTRTGPTYIPNNFSFSPGLDFSSGYTPAALSAGATLDFSTVTGMQSSAYQMVYSPSQSLASDAPNGSVTNQAGRIEIYAENSLNLTRASLSAISYIGIHVTNNFLGSQDARLVAPNFDFELRSTTGKMVITNLITPFLPFPDGSITLWSGLYTNVSTSGQTNGATITSRYHVLFVDTDFRPATLPQLETLLLGVTNNAGSSRDLFIADDVRATRSFRADARSLTIQSNGPDATAPYGELHILDGSIFGPDNTPGLQCFTNFGVFETLNAMFLGSSRNQPGNMLSFDNVPYRALVNHGTFLGQGMFISARYFESDGTFDVGTGSFALEKGAVANFYGGSLLAQDGNLKLTADYLFASNTTWTAGGALTLVATNYLDDGSYAMNSADGLMGTNVWTVGSGFNLLCLPAHASLLGTTLIATAGSNITVINSWAGADRGSSPEGFANNAALGHLVLDGLYGSRFIINPVGAHSALYVDRLELRDATAETVNEAGDWSGIYVAPGMTIYYGEAVTTDSTGTRSIAEKLNGRNDGRFVWVSSYNCGKYSSTFWGYPDGSINRVNTPLANSGDINSWAGFGPPYGDPNNPYANNANPGGPVPPSLLNNCVSAPLSLPVPDSNAVDGLKFSSPFTMPAVNWGQCYAASIASQASTLSRDQLTFAKVNGPSWLTVSPSGALSGTPGIADVGLNTFIVSATTPGGLSSLATMRVSVLSSSAGSALLEFPPRSSPVPFTNALGAYYGLFADTNGVTPTCAGYVAIGTTRGRGYSGWLLMNGRRYAFHGLFDANGLATNSVALSKTAALTVRLQSGFGGDQIRGSVNNGANWRADLVADRLVFSRLNTNRFAGSYTLVIPPDPNSSGSPGGYGVGTVTVSPLGLVRWVGILADGTTVSQSSALSKDGFWPLYSFTAAGSNLAISWMQFTHTYVGGQLVWTKMPYARAKYYGGGFTNNVEAQAFRYSPPAAGTRALPLNNGEGRIIFTGDSLSGTLTNAVSISSKNVIAPKSLSEGLRVTLIPSSGWFKGSATVSSQVLPFQGVLDQQDGVGWGFFLGPVVNGTGKSGAVYLSP